MPFVSEEMAQVEALLNRSVTSRQVDPSVASVAERRKQDLKDTLSAVASECVVSYLQPADSAQIIEAVEIGR